MTINRHNYETIFLMYVDNELSAAEKKAVDVFVKENTDLQEELTMLQQSVLHHGEIQFTDKAILLRGEGSVTEKLLLLLDNELDATETDRIKKEISNKPSLANEYGILEQTRLIPESNIIFTDKQALYKKEKSKVIALPWKRIAAAAVLIGFGIWGIATVINNKQKIEVANNNQPQNQSEKKITVPETADTNKDKADELVNAHVENNKTAAQSATNIIYEKAAPNKIAGNQTQLLNNPIVQNQPAVKEKVLNNPAEKIIEKNILKESNKASQSNVLPSVEVNPIAVSDKKENNAETEQLKKFDHILKEKKDYDMAINTNPIAKNISFTNEPDEYSDSRILYIKEQKLKNTKLGRLFGKVKQVLNNKDNINTLNGLRIGNLEIAIN